jgi:acetyl esterase/lipase
MRKLLLLGLVLPLLGLLPACLPRLSPNVQLTAGIEYGLGYVESGNGEFRLDPLLMDMLEPTNIEAENRPAILLIHGGSFESGSRKDEELVYFADKLASAGYVCFLSDYRVKGDGPPPAPDDFRVVNVVDIRIGLEDAVHAAFVDAKTALRFIRANAIDLGVDPGRIAVFGTSAGAFAAIAAGVSPVLDFAGDEGLPIPPENNFTVDPRAQAIISFWGSASPVIDDFDASDPPILVVHGTNDTQLGTFYTEALAIIERASVVGMTYRIHTLIGEGHGPWDATWEGKPLHELTLAFLADFL